MVNRLYLQSCKAKFSNGMSKIEAIKQKCKENI